MKRASIMFIQGAVVLIGISAFVLLLWEPQIEGRNVNATNFEIYFHDPFLALVYTGSIPFFVGVYQVFKLLGYIGQNRTFSQDSLKALKTIKYCAIAVIGFVIVEEISIILNHGDDDATGGFFMGVIITLGSILVAGIAAKFEKNFKKAINV